MAAVVAAAARSSKSIIPNQSIDVDGWDAKGDDAISAGV
jgi:hypothetical protein